MRLACLLIFLPLLSFSQLFHSGNGAGQTFNESSIHPLTIGDRVPDVVLNNIINYTSPSARLSSFSGKLLILDFFATWCTSCIKALPKLDSFQRVHHKDLQVLVVTSDNKEQIGSLLKRSKLLSSVSLPFITSDSILRNYWPHKFIPHYVWINREGIVAAITGPNEITDENITQWIAGGKINLPVKKDAMDYDHKKPLLADGNGGTEADLQYRFLVTRYLHGVPTADGLTKTAHGYRYCFTNHSIISFFQSIYRFAPNQLLLKTNHPEKYLVQGPDVTKWKQENHYSFELTTPLSWTKQKITNALIYQVNQYFGITAQKEKVSTPCFALITDSGRIEPSKAMKQQVKNIDDDRLAFYNHPVAALAGQFNYSAPFNASYPFIIDETGLKYPIDFELTTAERTDFNRFRIAVQRLGFKLVPVTRDVDMFVISDHN